MHAILCSQYAYSAVEVFSVWELLCPGVAEARECSCCGEMYSAGAKMSCLGSDMPVLYLSSRLLACLCALPSSARWLCSWRGWAQPNIL